jgi:hypothetical protein
MLLVVVAKFVNMGAGVVVVEVDDDSDNPGWLGSFGIPDTVP